MVTVSLPLSTVAALSKSSYHRLYGWTVPQVRALKGGSKEYPAQVQSYRHDGHVWLTASTINQLIESKRISDFTL